MRTDRQTDIVRIIVDFRNFAKAPKKYDRKTFYSLAKVYQMRVGNTVVVLW